MLSFAPWNQFFPRNFHLFNQLNRLCTEPASEPDFLSFGLDAPQAQTQIIKSVFMFVTYKHMSNNYLASFASVASQSVQTVCVFKGEGAERKMLRKRFRQLSPLWSHLNYVTKVYWTLYVYILNAMPLNYENLDSSDLYSIKISGPEAGSVHRPCERTGLEAGFDTSPRARYSSFRSFRENYSYFASRYLLL